MIVDIVYEIIWFEQSNWLENQKNHNTQNRNEATNDFKRDLCKLLNVAFYGKTKEIVRNRVKIEFIKNNEVYKIGIIQWKLTFHGIHESFENYDSYIFKQNEILMDKHI